MSTAAEKQLNGLGVIEDGVTYPLPLFMKLVGLSDWGMRLARRNGLIVRQVGRRRYVRGADWSRFLEQPDAAVRDSEAQP